jgi:hypothetical protein
MRDNPLFRLMQSGRAHFADPNQLLVTHLLPATDYYDFLSIILERYNDENSLYLAFLGNRLAQKQSGPLTAEQLEGLVKGGQLGKRVHLEIESFYVFAKILMDQLALFQQDLFGLGDGCSLASHGKLTKNFEEYCQQKNLQYTDELVHSQQQLETRIGDYRDDRIEHQKPSGYLKATVFRLPTDDEPGATRISHTRLGTIGEHVGMTSDPNIESGDIVELATAIDHYIGQVIAFITLNWDKVRFPLKG